MRYDIRKVTAKELKPFTAFNPKADSDRDGKLNYKDCNSLNPKEHALGPYSTRGFRGLLKFEPAK